MLLSNTKYFFFALVILTLTLLVSQQSFAEPFNIEHGINYDRQLIATHPDGSKTYAWTSTPFSASRIVGNDWQYKNYVLSEDSNNIYFESAQGSISFNKSTCTISSYGPGYINNGPRYTLSHTIKEAVNGTDIWTPRNENSLSCNYTISQNTEGIQIIAKRGDFSTIYDIDFIFGFEWTYKFTNNNSTDTNKKIGFTSVCNGNVCDDIRINGVKITDSIIPKELLDGKRITIGDAVFDPKDYVHDALWSIKKDNDKMSVDFTDSKGPIGYNQTITIDPTFGYTNAQSQQYVQTAATAQCYGAVANANGSSGVTSRIYVPSTGVADNCVIQVGKFIITSIQDGSTINSANLRFDQNGGGFTTNPRMVVARNMTLDPQGSATAAQKFIEGTQGNFAISPFTVSLSTNDQVKAFNTNGTTAIRNSLVQNWLGIALAFVSMRSDGTAHGLDQMINWELQVTYTVPPPNAVTTLSGTATSTSTVNLSWSAPNLNGGTLQRYVLNYSAICGTPDTFLANGTTATSYIVSGLTANHCYTFRVSAATEAGKNITGANIANVTTLAFNQANYTIGGFNFDADNPLRLPILFTRIDSGSQAKVNITYASTITNLSCDVSYTYAGTNHTYHNISGASISSSQKRAQIILNNSTNDIETIRCWNNNGNQSASFVVTQNNFLLKQQVTQFRSGTFGTHGQLGAFDFVTLIVVIIVMIGLNRNNETVGGIFCLIGISILAYFEIIQWYMALVAGIAVILLLIIASTRKD